jgi:hypothetical protein
MILEQRTFELPVGDYVCTWPDIRLLKGAERWFEAGHLATNKEPLDRLVRNELIVTEVRCLNTATID